MNKSEALKREIEFLSKLGITYTAFGECEYPGMLFSGDELVGYILVDEEGDLCTQIDAFDMKASYSCEPFASGITIRRITMIKDDKEIEISNIYCKRDNSDYLDYDIAGKENYSIKFEPGKISCGKSNTYQNIEVNGEWFKGKKGAVNATIERFRKICPELIDHYLSEYISEPKQKVKE